MATAERMSQQAVPFWRDVRIIAILLQILFAVTVVALLAFLYNNMMEGLERSNLLPTLDWIDQPAGFAISEGPAFTAADTYLDAFLVGIANTFRVAFSGVVLATLLGFILGISRLSNNWLLRNVASAYVEIVRNIPLLVQLIFWAAVTRAFPAPAQSIDVGGFLFLHSRGVNLAWPRGTETFTSWTWWLVAAVVVGILVYLWRRVQLARRDLPGTVLPWALAAAVGVAAAGLIVTTLVQGVAPIRVDLPVLDRFNFRGGTALTSPFAALLTGLTIYTAAFIGEIVRAGILAVSKGQREAAMALGLSQSQMLRLVILPQALRVVIPPMTNQYLNLTKNSSLAIAIAYPDLFAVGATILNQTGQTVPLILMIMGTYLIFSLTTSLFMNWYNRRIQLVER